MALNDLYQEIVELRDRFIESWQGKYGIVTGYGKMSIIEGLDPIQYLTKLVKEYEQFSISLSENDSLYKQIIDDINELLRSTIYKIKYLKN